MFATKRKRNINFVLPPYCQFKLQKVILTKDCIYLEDLSLQKKFQRSIFNYVSIPPQNFAQPPCRYYSCKNSEVGKYDSLQRHDMTFHENSFSVSRRNLGLGTSPPPLYEMRPASLRWISSESVYPARES
jgi:hypothetical protein